MDYSDLRQSQILAEKAMVKTIISWNINRSCNYSCSYCTQYDDKLKGKRVKNIELFLKALSSLEKAVEIKLSGGEPFLYPDFLALIRVLKEQGIYISVVTNFSSERDILKKFAQILGERLLVFSASLHLEHVKPEEFLQKSIWFKEQISEKSSFVVTSVAAPRRLTELLRIKEQFDEKNIRFKIQPLKYNGSIINYTAEEKKLLLELGGHNNTGVLQNNFYGKYCAAGKNYFVFGPTGDVWRCYQSKKERKEFMGNILENSFSPYKEIRKCSYDYCPCTVPIERGMTDIQI